MAETHKRCGATHPRLSDDNACREPAGHAGPHMTHDSMGRPEWTWEPGAEWVEVAAAVPDPRFRDQLAKTLHDTEPRGWLHYADAIMPLIDAEVEARVQAAARGAAPGRDQPWERA